MNIFYYPQLWIIISSVKYVSNLFLIVFSFYAIFFSFVYIPLASCLISCYFHFYYSLASQFHLMYKILCTLVISIQNQVDMFIKETSVYWIWLNVLARSVFLCWILFLKFLLASSIPFKQFSKDEHFLKISTLKWTLMFWLSKSSCRQICLSATLSE